MPGRARGELGARRRRASAAGRSADQSAAHRPRAPLPAAGRRRPGRRGRCPGRRDGEGEGEGADAGAGARGAGARGARAPPHPGAGGCAARPASRGRRWRRASLSARRPAGSPAARAPAPGTRYSRRRRGSCAGSSGRSRLQADEPEGSKG